MPNNRKKHILALDIGGTKSAAAIFDPDFNLLGDSKIPTQAEEEPDTVFDRILRMTDCLIGRCGIQPNALCGVGVGCAGHVDIESGIIHYALNLPDWDGFPLGDKLQNRFDAPVFVENDANAAALAELRFGAGRGYKNIIYITVSTGIGSGLIMDGKLWRGSNFAAGDFGHMILAQEGPECSCGGRGCLEALASGTAIAERAQREARRQPDSLLTRILADNNAFLTAKDVVEAVRDGDSLASAILRDAAFHIGLGITSAIHLLNPEIIIIGGGLAQAGDLLLDSIRRTVAERAQKHLAEFVQIVPAELGSRAGLYGALCVAAEGCRS
jgi:glucokinase